MKLKIDVKHWNNIELVKIQYFRPYCRQTFIIGYSQQTNQLVNRKTSTALN